MKKFLKSLLILALFCSPTSFIASCASKKNIVINHETNYLSAFNKIFSNENNEPFTLLPKLNKKESNNNLVNDVNNIEILKLEENDFKINCEKYKCEDIYNFKATSIDVETYNKSDKLIQYAFDDIAKWFSILPFDDKENNNIIYDFKKTKLELKFNYKNSSYFFNKYKNNKELVFWSKPIFSIKNDNKEIENKDLLLFDNNLNLNENNIKTFLEALNVKVKQNNQQDKNINQLEVTFKLEKVNKDLDQKVVLIRKVKNLFYQYQRDLEFKTESNGSNLSRNLNSFKLNNYLIEQILIKFIQGETK